MSSKCAQIKFIVSYFYFKKISILGSLDNAENGQKTTFFGTPNICSLFWPTVPWLVVVGIAVTIASMWRFGPAAKRLVSRVRIQIQQLLG